MKKAICFGETLWDILLTKKVEGGAPLNVAVHLCNMGIDVQMISRVGNDVLGRELTKFIENNGINSTFIQVDSLQATGVVHVDISDPINANYNIVSPRAWDFISLSKSMIDTVQKADVFVFGSLAARCKVSCNTMLDLLKVAKYRVFDANLRKPHFNKTTLDLLMKHADMVKLNEEEIEQITSWYGEFNNLRSQITFLKSKYKLDRLCVTRGGNGAILMDDNMFYEHPGYSVQVADTIGSGDSFLANLLKNLMQNIQPDIALQRACAMGAMVASHNGATPTISEMDIEKLIHEAK